MKIVGVDLHAKQQSIAMLDTETGELTEKVIRHEGNVNAPWISRGEARISNRDRGRLWSAFPGRRTQKRAASGKIASESILRNSARFIPKFIEEFVAASSWIGQETSGREAPIPSPLQVK